MISLSHCDIENHHRSTSNNLLHQKNNININKNNNKNVDKSNKPLKSVVQATERVALMNVTPCVYNNDSMKTTQHHTNNSSNAIYNDGDSNGLVMQYSGKRKQPPVIIDNNEHNTKQTSLYDYIRSNSSNINNNNHENQSIHSNTNTNDSIYSNEYDDLLMSSVSEVTDSTYKDSNDELHEMNDYMRETLKRKKQRLHNPSWLHYNHDVACKKYSRDILQRYYELESDRCYSTDSSYMTTKQSNELNYTMRSILIDWMVELNEEYNLQQNTLYLTVQYIDKFLSHIQVERSKLQLLGMGCSLIASKYWEIYPPSINDYIYLADNTYKNQQLIRMEQALLQTFQFNLNVVTCFDYRTYYYKANRSTIQHEYVCDYILEQCAHDELYIKNKPSTIMCSVVCYVNHLYSQTILPPQLSSVSRYQLSDLFHCIQSIYELHCRVVSTDHKLHAVHDKYKTDEKHNASTRFQPKSFQSIATLQSTATPITINNATNAERIQQFIKLMSGVFCTRHVEDESITVMYEYINIHAIKQNIDEYTRNEFDDICQLLERSNKVMISSGRIYKI